MALVTHAPFVGCSRLSHIGRRSTFRSLVAVRCRQYSVSIATLLQPLQSLHRQHAHRRHGRRPRAVSPESEGNETRQSLVGEDSAAFDASKQSTQAWVLFVGVFAVVMYALYVLWIQPGVGYGDDYLEALQAAAGYNPEITMTLLLAVFAIVHSGLAALRPQGEKLIGARAWRVLFAGISLPLAVAAIVYFINHRYDGTPLWNVRGIPGVHEAVWVTNFLSFFFLYPSTFNLLEVAAVDRPQLHMWESGIMRITRHPQMVGQFMWCLAHSVWIGNSFMLVATAGLMAHHLFACWHGDKRLSDKYGEAFDVVKSRTSIMPFQAIWEGRQQLPEDYYKEFLRLPYFVITAITLGAYVVHPYMQMASYNLGW